MKRLLLFLALCLSIPAISQERKIEIGVVDSFHSKILNEDQEIWVHVPKPSEHHKYFAPKRYPVVYLLDGDAHFQSVTGMVHYLSMGAEDGNEVSPEMIVVGILSKNRTRDLTPTHATKHWNGKEERYLKHSGGGEKFLTFIEKELIPYIDAHYPTDSYRMLIGHSFGGLFAVHTLLNKPKLFNSYVIIDPSLWWDDKLMLKKAAATVPQGTLGDRKLFLAIADTVIGKEEAGGHTAHIRANMAFARMLQKQQGSSASWHWKYYQGENHSKVPFLAEYGAFRTIFQHKPLRIPEAGVSDPAFHADFVKQHYQDISSETGYKMLPPEYMVNNLGLACLYRGLMDKAYSFFRLNMENYPQSFNVYNSMGNLYAKQGDKNKAIDFYTKALSIKNFPETQQKLADLRNGK